MNLAQLHDFANARSYYSRPDNEVYQALSSASKKIYLWTVREFRGYFIKFDTQTIVIQPNVQEYLCPPDLAIMIRIGEQIINSPPNTPFQWMRPADINSQAFIDREFASLILDTMNSARSQFVYYGPYLDMADASQAVNAAPQGPKKVRFAPIPIDSRNTSIAYAAKFLEITGPQSVLMMPSEAHEAILDYAVAELVRPNGDQMAMEYEGAGKDKFQSDFLPFMRQQQQTAYPTIEPYIEDMS